MMQICWKKKIYFFKVGKEHGPMPNLLQYGIDIDF